jgi:hypothetical protein
MIQAGARVINGGMILEIDDDGAPVVLGDDGVDDDVQHNAGKMMAWSMRSDASWDDDEWRPELRGEAASLRRRPLPTLQSNKKGIEVTVVIAASGRV